MKKLIIVLTFISITFVILWQYNSFEKLPSLYSQSDELLKVISDTGFWGPSIIIALMAFAIVMSPLPSAPIALASGALYGHIEGTLYVLIGSVLGAIIAFFISRFLGAHFIQKHLDILTTHKFMASQNALMGMVFVSRLIPFISFDVISYVAGLSVLTFWRFAIATLTGILPASFLLAHFGSEMRTSESSGFFYAILFLVLFMILPWLLPKKLNNYFVSMK